jgi:hypothetical protein
MWSGPSSPNSKVEGRSWLEDHFDPAKNPKFQHIELVWGGAASIVRVNSNALTVPSTRLRPTFALNFYGCEGQVTNVHELLDIAGCRARVKGEISAWITKDRNFEADGSGAT